MELWQFSSDKFYLKTQLKFNLINKIFSIQFHLKGLLWNIPNLNWLHLRWKLYRTDRSRLNSWLKIFWDQSWISHMLMLDRSASWMDSRRIPRFLDSPQIFSQPTEDRWGYLCWRWATWQASTKFETTNESLGRVKIQKCFIHMS